MPFSWRPTPGGRMGKVHDTRRTLAPSQSGEPTAALFTPQFPQVLVGVPRDIQCPISMDNTFIVACRISCNIV